MEHRDLRVVAQTSTHTHCDTAHVYLGEEFEYVVVRISEPDMVNDEKKFKT